MSNVFKGFGVNISQNPVKIELPTPAENVDYPVLEEAADDFEQGVGVLPEELPDPKELVEAALREAEQIKARAEAEVKTQHEAFLVELEQTKAQEKQKAYELGLIEGAEKRSQEIEQAIAALSDIVTEIKENFNSFIDEQRSDLVTLVLEVTEKILAKQIELDDMVMLPIIQKALQSVKIKSHCSIAVSEDADELITFLKRELKKSQNSDSAMFDIVAKDMPLDFCVLEVDDSCLDISVSAQFENLKNFLKHSE